MSLPTRHTQPHIWLNLPPRFENLSPWVCLWLLLWPWVRQKPLLTYSIRKSCLEHKAKLSLAQTENKQNEQTCDDFNSLHFLRFERSQKRKHDDDFKKRKPRKINESFNDFISEFLNLQSLRLRFKLPIVKIAVKSLDCLHRHLSI